MGFQMDYDLDDIKTISATFALIIFLLWDVVLDVAKDYFKLKISAWVPSNLFVLSALTIQILSYVDIQRMNVFGASVEKDMKELVENQLRMDAARLAMCVFVGCLLPGMAIAGTQGRWSSAAALFVSLLFHIATEIYALQNVNDSALEREAGPWFVSSGVILLLAASSLLLLLGVVISSGKASRDFIRIKLMFFDVESKNKSDKRKRLREEMMKSWVALRAWKTYYFVISSIISPGAGVIVTICVVVVAVKVRCRSSLLLLPHNNGVNFIFYLQCIFILVGWFLMLFRWFKAALYCGPSLPYDRIISIIRFSFFVPSVVLIYLLNPRLVYYLGNLNHSSIREISISCFVALLALGVPILSVSLVGLFCSICWLLSAVVFGTQFVQQLCKLDKVSQSADREYSNFYKLLPDLAQDVELTYWAVNKKSFKRIKAVMDECSKRAKSCAGLLSTMRVELTEGKHLQLENDRDNEGWMGVVAKIFKSVPDDIINDFSDALAAYRETLDVLKFVDCPDNIVVDPFNIFGTLNLWGFLTSIGSEIEMFNVERKLKQTESVEEKQQSTTQDREVWGDLPLRGFDLNRLLECRDNKNKLGQTLRELVSKVIVSAVLEAVDVLLKNRRKWVENYDEKRMERGVEMAGKVSGLIEKLVEIGCIREDEDAERSGEGPSQIGHATEGPEIQDDIEAVYRMI